MSWFVKPRKRNIFNRGSRKQKPITLATSVGKVTKSEADYVNYSRSKHCDNCVMFRPPGTCTKVVGDISMVGTCRFWEEKSKLGIEG